MSRTHPVSDSADHLSAEGLTAFRTADDFCEGVICSGLAVFTFSFVQESLYRFEGGFFYNCGVTVLHIVLRLLTAIQALSEGECIGCIFLLEKSISDISLICQYISDSTVTPFCFSVFTGDFVLNQYVCDVLNTDSV